MRTAEYTRPSGPMLIEPRESGCLPSMRFPSDRAVPRHLVVLGDGRGPALPVDEGVGLVAEDRAQVAVALLRVLGVEEHPVLVLAGDHVDQAARLVGDD